MDLESKYYGKIEYNMSHANHQLDSTLQTVNDNDAYLYRLPSPYPTIQYDSSLVRQMEQLRSGQRESVDAFYFTVKSAVPVADTLRGYYQALGISAPPLEPIYANSSDGIFHRRDNTYCSGPELARLRESAAGADHVAVIDQYVVSGHTLLYAAHLLLMAGAKQVTAISGSWYAEAYRNDVDVNNMTSCHSDFMRQVGRNCIEDPQRLDYIRTRR